MTNLKDLSRRLGLSPTTVSRALNGYPEVSAATRARVEAMARALDYSPNARAQGLATGRARAIGHVFPVSSRNEIVNPVFADFITGAGEAYTQAGYDLVLSVVDDRDEAAAYRRMRARGSVDGVIVHGPRMADPRIALLRDLGLPFVVHGRASDVDLPYDWLDTDNARAFARATDMLLDLGHRRIALINGLEAMDFAHRRRAGYVAALDARGITADPALMRSDTMTEDYGFSAACALLEAPDPPTAFLASSMIVAIGVRRAIEDSGLRIGRDVSVITHDDDLGYLKNGAHEAIFTAVRSSVRLAGRRAAEILLARIDDPALPHAAEMLPTELIIGTSTGPAPTA
jgi:LacI family transcriptional regulator